MSSTDVARELRKLLKLLARGNPRFDAINNCNYKVGCLDPDELGKHFEPLSETLEQLACAFECCENCEFALIDKLQAILDAEAVRSSVTSGNPAA